MSDAVRAFSWLLAVSGNHIVTQCQYCPFLNSASHHERSPPTRRCRRDQGVDNLFKPWTICSNSDSVLVGAGMRHVGIVHRRLAPPLAARKPWMMGTAIPTPESLEVRPMEVEAVLYLYKEAGEIIKDVDKHLQAPKPVAVAGFARRKLWA